MKRFDEAILEGKRAVELDPLSPMINTSYASFFYRARRYDEAISQLKKILEMYPEFDIAQIRLGKCYLQKEMFVEALNELKNSGSPYLVFAQIALGKFDEARKVLEELEERSQKEYIDPLNLAIAYLGLGKIDKVFEFLEKARQEHSPEFIKVIDLEPFFDYIRSDPRFVALRKIVGLEE
jgi:tetratricopeptide (TPR) repeat protein